jgi:hypothetical protein
MTGSTAPVDLADAMRNLRDVHQRWMDRVSIVDSSGERHFDGGSMSGELNDAIERVLPRADPGDSCEGAP